ncbi:MAG: hypothetical protein KBB21_12135 [Nannocystaceae bacterium]|nr:hypothetical protein [Deltaproteobacteria bacterium]MBP7287363.1 hypothetical protein [Nannocystaceae bacterium]
MKRTFITACIATPLLVAAVGQLPDSTYFVPQANAAENPVNANSALAEFRSRHSEWVSGTGYAGGEMFSAIQHSYAIRDGKAYARVTRAELAVLRYLTPDECAVRQDDLLEYVAEAGADGLEGLLLSYQDCTAWSRDPAVVAVSAANANRMRDVVWFADEPAPSVHVRVAYRNDLAERAIRGAAARVVVEQMIGLDADVIARSDLATIMGDVLVNDALCDLAGPTYKSGVLAPASIVAGGSCAATGTPGGWGTIEEMCEQLAAESGGKMPGGATPLQDELQGSYGFSEDEISWLSDYCDNRASGGAMSGSTSPLDGFTEDDCSASMAQEIADGMGLLTSMQECLATDEGNPLADGPALNPTGWIPGSGWITNPGQQGIVYAVKKWIEAVELVTTGMDYIDRAREAGCYQPGAKCENNAAGDPVCVSGCPGSSGTTSSTSSSSTTTSSSSTTTSSSSTTSSSTTTSSSSTTTSASGGDTGGEGDEGEATGAADGGDAAGGLEPGGFDPKNPACQELLSMGVLTKDGFADRGAFFDALFKRKPGEDPRKSHPVPDDHDSTAADEMCGEFGGGAPTGSECKTPVTCPLGQFMDDDCGCSSTNTWGGPPLGDLACVDAMCPETALLARAGGFDCMCSEGGGDVDPMSPLPEPPEVSIGVMSMPDGKAERQLAEVLAAEQRP